MAVTDKRAIDFSNQWLRTAADVLARGYSSGSGILSMWQIQQVAALIADDAAELLADGSPDDGRPPMSGADAHLVIEALQAFKAAFDATASNGQSHITNILRVSPNPTPRIQVNI